MAKKKKTSYEQWAKQNNSAWANTKDVVVTSGRAMREVFRESAQNARNEQYSTPGFNPYQDYNTALRYGQDLKRLNDSLKGQNLFVNSVRNGSVNPLGAYRQQNAIQSALRNYNDMMSQVNGEADFNEKYAYPLKYQGLQNAAGVTARLQGMQRNIAALRQSGDKKKADALQAEYDWLNQRQYDYWKPEDFDAKIKSLTGLADQANASSRTHGNYIQTSTGLQRKTTPGTMYDMPNSAENLEAADLEREKRLRAQIGQLKATKEQYAYRDVFSNLSAEERNRVSDAAKVIARYGGWDYARRENLDSYKNAVKSLQNAGYSIEEADAIIRYATLDTTAQNRADLLKSVSDWTDQNVVTKAIGSIASIPMSIQGGVGYLGMLADKFTSIGQTDPFTGDSFRVDTNAAATAMSDLSQALRGAASKDMSGLGKLVYNATMSFADSMLAMATGEWTGEAALGLSAATQATKDAYARGATDTQALVMGGMAGLAESLFEHISIDKLRIMRTSNAAARKTIKEFALDWVKQSITEASEEGATDIANLISDAIIMGDKSELNTMIRQYRDSGMSEPDATVQAWKDWGAQVFEDMAAGFLSGGMGTVTNTGIGTFQRNAGYLSEGRKILKAGNASALKELGAALPEGSYGRGLAENINTEGTSKKTARQLGALASEVNQNTLRQGVQSRLEQLGVTNASETATAIMRELNGQTTTRAQDQLLKGKAAQRVLTEFRSAAEGSTNYTNEWAYDALYENAERGRNLRTNDEAVKEVAEFAKDYGRHEEAVNKLFKLQSDMPVESFKTGFDAAYTMGKNGVDMEQAMTATATQRMSETQRALAWEIGRSAANNTTTEEGVNVNGEEGSVSVPGGGERYDGARAEESVGKLAEGAEPSKGNGQVLSRSAKDSGAADLKYEVEPVSTADFGIAGGTQNKSIYRVSENQKLTPAVQAAVDTAKANGRNIVLFGGGNLEVRDGDAIASVRGLYDPNTNTMYVRVDHKKYTAEQIAKHENGHGLIADGRITVKEVQDYMKRTMDEEAVEQALADYADAYDGIQMTDEALWHEIICDALGSMNIFEGEYEFSERAERAEQRGEAIRNAAAEMQKGRAPPETASEDFDLNDNQITSGVKYSREETNPETLRFLNEQLRDGNVVHTYKTFLEVRDGDNILLYPPMATKQRDGNGKLKMANVMKLNVWERSVGNPDSKGIVSKVGKDGKTKWYYRLVKDNGKTVDAAYDPYQHSSDVVLNDQFESAYQRPNLVTYECVIPKSELSSGFHYKQARSDGQVVEAALPVGQHKWKKGTVAGKLKNTERSVYLTRWLMPVRRLENSEVAQKYKEILDKESNPPAIPFNVVPPGLLAELEKAGVAIDYEGSPMYKSRAKKQSFSRELSTMDKQEIINSVGVQLDEGNDSASPSSFSRETWNESEYVQNREQAAQELSKALGISIAKAKKYISDVNGIAKMIADDRARLDYESSPGRSSFVGNTEYGGSIDFSTVCKKRRLYTGTIEAIQRAFPDRALTADELLKIRSYMAERGYEVNCGFCYVEGSRAKMGKYTKQFLDEYRQSGAEYVPTMAEMNTATGQEQIRREHPEVYDAYVKFMNKLAQRKPKLFQLATAYKGEILQKFKRGESVEEKNRNGGLRLQSFSDFEIIHLIDTMQVIMDMSRVGLAGQAYTKVPDFAWAFGRTGLKINLSLVAKGVDENGRLVYDDVEGMDHNEAKKLRDAYSKNVGTILVVFDDAQLKAAMADDFVDFIIPFHRSQWSKKDYAKMGLAPTTKDYTSKQNERYIKPVYGTKKDGSPKKLRAENFMPNTYWDFNKSGKENAEEYLRMCAEANKRPKFANLLVDNKDGSFSLQPDGSTDGYWKLLIDFKMYDNKGKGSPQMPVRPDFNMSQARRMLNEYTGGHQSFPVAQDVVDHFKKELGGKKQIFSRELSALDSDYMTAVESGDMEKAQEIVDEAAKKAGYNSPKLYHGTNAFGFTVIDTRKSNDRISFFATDSAETAGTYSGTSAAREIGTGGDSTIGIYQLYANTDGMLELDAGGEESGHIALGSSARDYNDTMNTKSWNSYATAKQIAKYAKRRGYTGVIIHNVIDSATPESRKALPPSNVYVFFNPQAQVKSADPVTYDDKGKPIHLDERFSDKKDLRYSRELDDQYMAAAQAGDVETAQRMVDEAARKAGYPVRAYHQTGADFTEFSTDHPVAGRNDSETPNGIFFKMNDHDIGLEGKKQMGVYLKTGRMLHFKNREQANAWYQKNIGGYRALQNEMRAKLKPFEDELERIERLMFSEETDDDRYNELDERWNEKLEQMRVVEDAYRGRLRELLNDYFLNHDSGYDSIKLDYDGHRYVDGKRENVETIILFDGRDVKSADPVTYDDNGNIIPLSERFNPDEQDIRYSRDLENLDELIEENNRLKKRMNEMRRGNENLQNRLDAAKQQTKRTTEPTLREDDVRKAARGLLKEMDSTLSVDDVADDMKALGEYMMRGEGKNERAPSWEEVKRRASEIAERIVDNASALSEASDVELYKELRKYLRTTKLTLAESDRADMQDGYAEFVKRNFNRIKLGNDGLPVDSAYQELQEMYGKGLFPDDITHPADQLMHIEDVLNGLQPVYENPHSYHRQEAVAWAANAVIDTLLSEDVRQTAPTFADKAEARREKDVAEAVAWERYKGEQREDRLKERYAKRMKDALQKAKERRARDIDRLVLKQKFKESARKERSARTALWNKILDLKKDFRRMVEKPQQADSKHAPLRLARALDGVTSCFSVENRERILPISELDRALGKLRDVYKLAEKDDELALYYDEGLIDNIDAVRTMLNEVDPFDATLDSQKLQKVYDLLKMCKHNVTTANQFVSRNWAKTIIEAGRKWAAEIASASIIFKKGFAAQLLNYQLRPDSMFARFSGFAKNSVGEQIQEMFVDGEEKMLRIQQDFYYAFERFSKSKEFDKLTRHGKASLVDVGLKDENGNAIKLTRDQMLALYMNLRSEDNILALAYGGADIPGVSTYYTGKVAKSFDDSVRTVSIDANVFKLIDEARNLADEAQGENVTDERRQEIQQRLDELQSEVKALEQEAFTNLFGVKAKIEKQLTKFEKDLVEAADEWMLKSKDYINAETKAMYGIEKAQVEHYWPIHRNMNFVNTDMRTAVNEINLENWGSLKERVKSHAPIKLTGFIFELDNHTKKMSQFCGFAAAQRDFNKLYQTRMPYQHSTLKEQIAKKFGSDSGLIGVSGMEYIDNYIAAVSGGGDATKPSVLAWARRNLPRATLSANFRVAMSQVASVPTAAAEVGWRAMAKGFARYSLKGFSGKQIEALAKADPWFWQRSRGEGGMREFAEMKGNTFALDRGYNKIAGTKVGKALLNWCQKFDMYATYTQWAMAEEWVKQNRKDLKKGSEAFDEAVSRKYRDILRRTQPNYTVTERSDLLRDKRESMKWATMYKTQSNQNLNILYDATAQLRQYTRDFKNGKNGVTQQDVADARRQFARAYSGVILGGTVTFVLFRAFANALLHAMNAYRDDDDKELTLESFLEGLGEETLGAISGMFLLGSEIEEFVFAAVTHGKYWGLSDSAISAISDVVKNLYNLTQDPSKEQILKFVNSLAAPLGLPIGNVKKIVDGIGYHIEDIRNGEFLSFDAGVNRTAQQQASRFAKAMDDGDTSKMKRIYDEMVATSKAKDPEANTQEALRGQIKDAFIGTDGKATLSESEALKLLEKFGGKTGDEAKDILNKWKFEKEFGYEYKELDDKYIAGELSDSEYKNALMNYGGKSEEDASEIVGKKKLVKEYGFEYSEDNIVDTAIAGDITTEEAFDIWTNYGGVNDREAENRATRLQFVVDNPGIAYDDAKIGMVTDYDEYVAAAKGANIKPFSAEDFSEYWLAADSLSSDYDANGNPIKGSERKDKVFAYIASLNIPAEQKTAIALSMYAAKTVSKMKTW